MPVHDSTTATPTLRHLTLNLLIIFTHFLLNRILLQFLSSLEDWLLAGATLNKPHREILLFYRSCSNNETEVGAFEIISAECLVMESLGKEIDTLGIFVMLRTWGLFVCDACAV